MVLIHGGGSNIESTFGNFLPLLSGYGKRIAVERRAHGRTRDRDVPESFEQDADDVAALLKYLNVEKANIPGFSNGGTTTLLLAGDRDVVRPQHLVKMWHLIPGARLAILPGDHGSFIGEICSELKDSRIPEMTALMVQEFLRE
jgi:pimeloyl-ACP methyl ester carboxylesterase